MRDALAPGNAAVYFHAAGVGHQDPGQDLHGGRLARAVRADVAEAFAAFGAEGNAGQRFDGAKTAGEESALGHAEGLPKGFHADLGHSGMSAAIRSLAPTSAPVLLKEAQSRRSGHGARLYAEIQQQPVPEWKEEPTA